MVTSAAEKWSRVSAKSPCPICGKSDNCNIARDGSAALCGRIPSDKQYPGGGQWLHRLNGHAPHAHSGNGHAHAGNAAAPTGEKGMPAAIDWSARHAGYCRGYSTIIRRKQLAKSIGVSVGAADDLEVGFVHGFETIGEAWTFPERDAVSAIIGISFRRSKDGRKSNRGKRGITFAANWIDTPGPIVVVEGASDTLAGLTLGLATIGRPGASAGVDHLVELFAAVSRRPPHHHHGRKRCEGRWNMARSRRGKVRRCSPRQAAESPDRMGVATGGSEGRAGVAQRGQPRRAGIHRRAAARNDHAGFGRVDRSPREVAFPR